VDNAAYPALGEWLEVLTPVIERTRSVPEEGGLRWRRTVEENVLEQLSNAVAYPAVARAVEAGDIELHGWVFDLGTGALRVYHREAEGFVNASSLLEAS
jgi:carbonic anhydrase